MDGWEPRVRSCSRTAVNIPVCPSALRDYREWRPVQTTTSHIHSDGGPARKEGVGEARAADPLNKMLLKLIGAFITITELL